MRLLALVTDAFGGSGGIAQYNRDLFRALGQCGPEADVLVLPRHGRPDRALPPGVRQLAPHATRLGYLLAALRQAATGGPFDAVFCGHLYMAPLGALVAGLLRVPLWLQLHGVEAWMPLTQWQRWAASRTGLITAVSRHTRRRFLRSANMSPWRVRVLPNTVDERFAPGSKPDYLLDRHRLRGKVVLMTVGRLAPDERRKGHDQVIRALPHMVETTPDLVYLVVGDGEDRARLAEMSRQLGVAERVLFTGPVAHDELADYYRSADVFVMPSTQEGFGIVFLEAAASGLRLIGGHLDGSLDALADGAIGLAIDPASEDDLVRAVERSLARGGPDPAGVRRFAPDNFARHARVLSKLLLAQGASA